MITVRAVGVDDWATWRELRLAALADAPHAFTSSFDECCRNGLIADESSDGHSFSAHP